MEKTIKTNYKLTICNDTNNCKIINNLHDEVLSETLFPKMIETLVNKNNIKFSIIYVENLKKHTWGKILNKSLTKFMDNDDYTYDWLNYKIDDIQKMFGLFDKKLNIIINPSGMGGCVGEKEGIKFVVNSNEKDRHKYEPHVHCFYSNEEMRIRIDSLEIMKKDKSFSNSKKTKLAKNWIKQNQKGLLSYYERFAINGDNSIKFEAVI